MTSSVFYVAQRRSLSHTLGFTIECAGGPERRSAERGGGAAASCLSPKVRGEDSQCLQQGIAERKKYLKVRPPIDFFSFSQREMCELEEKNTCVKTCLFRLGETALSCLHT